jgi:hypothetical protein
MCDAMATLSVSWNFVSALFAPKFAFATPLCPSARGAHSSSDRLAICDDPIGRGCIISAELSGRSGLGQDKAVRQKRYHDRRAKYYSLGNHFNPPAYGPRQAAASIMRHDRFEKRSSGLKYHFTNTKSAYRAVSGTLNK